MTLCKHEMEAGTCTIELYGLDYDPWGNFHTDRSDDIEWDVAALSLYPSDNPCPSQADWDRLEMLEHARLEGCLACMSIEDPTPPYYDDHTCGTDEAWVPRPAATEYPSPRIVGRPDWATQYEFAGTSFLGFYKNELLAATGFGIDPWFASIH
jgi:hypothetical protein